MVPLADDKERSKDSVADKKIITPFEALKSVAEHLGCFYYLYDANEESTDENKRVLDAIIGTAVSYDTGDITFEGSKERWNLTTSHMKAFMKLKKLADKGLIQYSEHKDGYGFPIFEVSMLDAAVLEKRYEAEQACRRAKMSEALHAKVNEVMEQVFFGNGGGN